MCFSCSDKKVLSPDEYMTYMDSHKDVLKISRELNSVNYSLQMLTPEQQILINSPDVFNNPAAFEKELSYYRNKLNFILVLKDPEKGMNKVRSTMFDKSEYGKILAYANTSLKEDFYLVQNEDTLYSTIVHLESANSIQPVFRLALGFSGLDSLSKECTLVFNDKIFNNGPIKFHYSKNVLSNLPEIKM